MVTFYILGLLLIAILLFSLEKLSVDVITLLLLLALLIPGILTPQEAFSGFSSDIIIILASIFVISAALQEAGVLKRLGAELKRRSQVGSKTFLLSLMASVGAISAFMNNTTVTALFTPIVTSLAREGKISPSKLLMPVAFASILGGTITLIGTSTNVAVSGFIQHAGMQPLGMFEMAPIGIIILAVGIFYMLIVGVHILPARGAGDIREGFSLRQFLSEICVLPDSPLAGQTLAGSDLAILDFQVLKIMRGNQMIFPTASTRLEANDRLIVSGHLPNLMKVRKIEGIEIHADRLISSKDLAGGEMQIAEVLVSAKSELVGKNLRETNLHRRAGALVLAIYRHGQTLVQAMDEIRLREGDVLLVQAPPARFRLLENNFGLPVLDNIEEETKNPGRGLLILAIFILAILTGSLGILPLSVSFLTAALATILLKGVSIERAYHFIDWRLLILIGGMTAFGVAMEKTGTANLLAQAIYHSVGNLGPHFVLASFFLLTIFLTQPMSNAAAALVVLPVAIETAELIGANPRTFAISVMLAASVSFIAPLEPSCVIVYGPGKYKFFDFVKVGLGLTLLLGIVVLFLVPTLWPLF